MGLTTAVAQAQIQQRFPVTAKQVLAVMQMHDLPIGLVQVRLAAYITTSVADPELDIESVAISQPHEALLRIACRIHTECLPFFVSAVWPNSAPALSASGPLGSGDTHIAIDQPTRSRPSVLLHSSTGTSGQEHLLDAPTVRAGAHATLMIEGERVHVLLQVLCLESGNVGDKVRVTTVDHKQMYVAKVLTPTLVTGDL